MTAYNSAWEGTCREREDREACCNMIAWAAVKKNYEKPEGSTRWHEKAAQMEITSGMITLAVISNMSEFINAETHDAILQGLERWISHPSLGQIYLSLDAFQKTLEDWNGIPLVFAQEHPDLEKMMANETEAIKAVSGKLVGRAKRMRIDMHGHPRLVGKLPINDDEVNKLNEEGKLSPSTAFFAGVDKNKKIISVVPNHILLFREDAENKPRDLGAWILNKEVSMNEGSEGNEPGGTDIKNLGKMLSTENVNILQKAYEAIGALLKKAVGKEPPKKTQSEEEKEAKAKELKHKMDLEELLAVANKEKDSLSHKVDELTQKIGDSDKIITEMKQKLEDFEKEQTERETKAKEEQWEQVKNKLLLPGMTHKEEDEAKLKEQFMQDPHGFIMQVVNMKKLPQDKGAEGTEFPGEGADKDQEAVDALMKEAGIGFEVS